MLCFRLSRLLIVVIGALLLLACAASAPQKQPPAEEVDSGLSRQQQRTVSSLLRRAEDAVEENRLTTPLEDNALDRYRAVLVIDADNAEAKSGLDNIVSRYLHWARTNIDRNDLTRAAIMLTRAEAVDPDNSQVGVMRTEIRQKAPQVLETRPQAARDNEWPLDRARLDSRHPRLVSELAVLARRLKLSGETMLIVARNDSEGRWIYKQMRTAVPGYRLRGNIELGRAPKVVIQPSI